MAIEDMYCAPRNQMIDNVAKKKNSVPVAVKEIICQIFTIKPFSKPFLFADCQH